MAGENDDALKAIKNFRKEYFVKENFLEVNRSLLSFSDEEEISKILIENNQNFHKGRNVVNDHVDDLDKSSPPPQSPDKIQELLLKQKDISSQELDNEVKNQELLIEELSNLTYMLKESTLDVANKVALQNLDLELIQKYAVKNHEEIIDQKKSVKEREKAMTSSIFTNITTVLYISIVFLLAYFFIRIFPKPR